MSRWRKNPEKVRGVEVWRKMSDLLSKKITPDAVCFTYDVENNKTVSIAEGSKVEGNWRGQTGLDVVNPWVF